ncbi:uncharacterized protein UV8b_05018 [Ustilaginoidea virens]|uniref:Uncharacterized protein n=1 Tax=Ustilaginoidea virens TaxID=1159556 RepID=A0A8E5MI91_USTVR|nr:uncharacterized protein UV8b_05018 [Ustilaginoidea virens]QUC20777.1 hypothetical protein UV8b_05018 [Ustilaginoidea virens]
MGASPPFMYNAERRNNANFPAAAFDPKAVTRASWEPKPRKPPHTGPLVSFNRHPDAHGILSHQTSSYWPLGRRSKKWIKWLRTLQLSIRIMELNGALGSLVLFSLLANIDEATGWILRVLPGIAVIHCLYAIYHLSRKAGGRTPGSSAAYHVFAAGFDLISVSAYAFGAFSVRQDAGKWTTRVTNQGLMHYFVPAVYYMIIGAGSLHLVSLPISVWLGMMFRRISMMPPDMNPLEDHLTARPFHKRSKSSLANTSSVSGSQSPSSPIIDPCAHSDLEVGVDARKSFVPFLYTRTGSNQSIGSRGFLIDSPSRQCQIVSGNSINNSVQSPASQRGSTSRSSQPFLYSSVPTIEAEAPYPNPAGNTSNMNRPGKFTETWLPTNSLISRTNQRNEKLASSMPVTCQAGSDRKPYAALIQVRDDDDSSGSECYGDSIAVQNKRRSQLKTEKHPDPLGSHPLSVNKHSHFKSTRASQGVMGIVRTKDGSLVELSGNLRKVSNSRDITDEALEIHGNPFQRQKDNSLQSQYCFHSKSHSNQSNAKPPIVLGFGRKVSSGTDYGLGYRRNVSGKVMEEGGRFR